MVRDRQIAIRLSDEEFEALDEATKLEEVPASIIIRGAIRYELARLKEAREERKRMSNQGFFVTAHGERYHWTFYPEVNEAIFSGPLPTPAQTRLTVYTKDEAKLEIARILGPGEFR